MKEEEGVQEKKFKVYPRGHPECPELGRQHARFRSAGKILFAGEFRDFAHFRRFSLRFLKCKPGLKMVDGGMVKCIPIHIYYATPLSMPPKSIPPIYAS